MTPIIAILAVATAAYVAGAAFGIPVMERIKTLLALAGIMVLVLVFAVATTGFVLP